VSEPTAIENADIAITHATVLTHGETGGIEFREDQTILISGNEIAEITASGQWPPKADEVIDARGMVAMPGFINCHSHAPMVMFRGAAEDVPAETWFNDYMWPMETNMTDADVELATELATAEMIMSGTTTFADHYMPMPSVAAATERSGLRAVLGATFFSSEGAGGLDRSLEFATTWNGRAEGRITTVLAPHAPYTVSDEDLARTATAASESGLLVHLHASENPDQTRNSLARHGRTPIQVLEDSGLLEGPVLIAHGVGVVPEDVPILSARARTLSFATSPKGYLKWWGVQTTPIRLLNSLGIPVGLATDGAGSNNTLDMWESLSFMLLTQKAAENDPRWMTCRHALDIATTQSARALGLSSSIGKLAAGYKADLILVDMSSPRVQPIHDLANTLVLSSHSDDIRTTIVDGRVLMRDRKLTGIDVEGIASELTARLPRLANRSHGRRIQSYDA
jgi:5-methylthioadenosine/S-adenosylhomocysteine deaminase